MIKHGIHLKLVKDALYQGSRAYHGIIGGVEVYFVKTTEKVFRNGHSNWDGQKRVTIWIGRALQTPHRSYADQADTLHDAVSQALSTAKLLGDRDSLKPTSI